MSDLHRATGADAITNDELLDSLLTDREVLGLGDPPIPLPEAVVVSGDLVQGVPLGDPAYPESLIQQYEEAHEFLVDLTDSLLGGDRSRLIIVPGNHDIDWNGAREFLDVHDSNHNPYDLLTQTDSPYRWSWSERRLYYVTSRDDYESAKLKYFAELCDRFYSGVPLRFPLEPERYWNLFDINGRIAIAGFNSCRNNDCYSFFGEIPRRAIAEANIALRACSRTYDLKIAVWHHNLGGPPLGSDYMDPNSVIQFIPQGFRLGLHGHQHMPKADPVVLSLAEREESIAVVSAGSLCAGRTDLPPGVGRQYNVVDIREDFSGARIHVREMTVPGVNVFARGRMPRQGGRSYFDLRWHPSQKPANTDAQEGAATVQEAEAALANSEPSRAVDALRSHSGRLPPHGRMILRTALEQTSDHESAVELLGQPRNPAEVTLLVRAHGGLSQWDEAVEIIGRAEEQHMLDSASARELRAWIRIQRDLRS